MRSFFISAVVAWLTCFALPQQPATSPKIVKNKQADAASTDSDLKDLLESKVKAEWEALKAKDKKAYADLIADDYEGVEVDGRGERNKIQAVNEVTEGNVHNYTLWGYKFTPLGQDAAFVVYEITMEFSPKSVVRYSRVYIGELWVKRNGQWKELHYQETHVK